MRLFDSHSRQIRPLVPLDGARFRFYCCGPTVYGPAHIGNFRTFVLQDVLRRCLELSGLATLHVRNITDVDDKTIRGAHEAGLSLAAFTAPWTARFHADCAALACFAPHAEPAATAFLPQQVSMIASLLEKGHAYPGQDGSVYFRIASFPGYGALSRLDTRDLDLGRTAMARADADEYAKDDAADFVLWKARRPEDGDVWWPSPWGQGRPGWHLECSAMIHELLGPDFDLHSGGVDLVFPHHENEIAQSVCACGGGFARHWFHITHLLVDGGKMSKSLGNLYTLTDLAERGFGAAELRYVLAGGFYRRPLNFTLDSLRDARAALDRLARAEMALAESAGGGDVPDFAGLVDVPDGPLAPAWESLRDDLNTPEALGRTFVALREAKGKGLSRSEAREMRLALHRFLAALGVSLPATGKSDGGGAEGPPEVKALAEKRLAAKRDKDWAAADALRDEITALGWVVTDTRDGYSLAPAG